MEKSMMKTKSGGERFEPDMPSMYHVAQTCINKYIFASRFVQNKVILDVASGAGYGSNYLVEKGAKKVVGGDISVDAIEYGRAHYRSDDLEFVRLGAVKLPFSSDCFDVIVSFGTVAHLKEYEDFLSECKRVLKDQGLFICSTPNKEISSPKTERPLDCWHDKEFYVGEFHDLLNKYFTDIVLYGQRCLSDKQKTIDYIMANLGRKISTLPKGEQLKSLIARFVLRQNRRIRLRAEVALEKVSDKRYEPVPLHDNPLTPSIIIALATADKAR